MHIRDRRSLCGPVASHQQTAPVQGWERTIEFQLSKGSKTWCRCCEKPCYDLVMGLLTAQESYDGVRHDPQRPIRLPLMAGTHDTASKRSASRVSVDDWIQAGYAILAEEGIKALKVDRLCERLGVTKGSFYWHFEGMPRYAPHSLRRGGTARRGPPQLR